MRLAHFFFVLIIVGALAAGTYAQTPLDPTVVVADPPGPPPPCGGSGEPVCYNGVGPLVENFNTPMGFEYTGTPNLTSFTLEFMFVPTGTPFGCQTDIWALCTISFPDLNTADFKFKNPVAGVPFPCSFNDGTGGTCPGFLATGGVASVTLQADVSDTPEPPSIILFGMGLALIAFVVKR